MRKTNSVSMLSVLELRDNENGMHASVHTYLQVLFDTLHLHLTNYDRNASKCPDKV